MGEVINQGMKRARTYGKVCVMSGSNMGKTDARTLARCIDEYGPAPTVTLLQEFMERHRQPREVQVCEVCGCAHYSTMGHLCNSCFDGIRSVHMAAMHERIAAAFRRLGEAAAQCGASFRRATETMSSLMRVDDIGDVLVFNVNAPGGPIWPGHPYLHGDYPREVISTASLDWCKGVPDPIADIEAGMRTVWERTQRPLHFIDPCKRLDFDLDNFLFGAPPMSVIPKLNLSSIYGRLGDRWQDETRPANAKEFIEQKKARRQKERGPAKHGKWWLR